MNINVQVYNPESGTKKYTGQIVQFVSNNGFVLAVIIDEQGHIKCERLEAIKQMKGESNESGSNERMDAGGGAVINPPTNGQSDRESTSSQRSIRRR